MKKQRSFGTILLNALPMNALLAFFLILSACSSSSAAREVIFDTDWWTDVDDAVAIRLLRKAETDGAFHIRGICLDAVRKTSVASLSSFLSYEGLRDIPMGADKLATDYDGTPAYHDTIIARHPQRECQSLDEVEDCVRFYRRRLLESRDSVDIILVGYPNALARFLESGGDALSPLSGREIARRKCRRLWMMGGQISPRSGEQLQAHRTKPEGSQGHP